VSYVGDFFNTCRKSCIIKSGNKTIQLLREARLIIVNVYSKVKPDSIEDFRKATLENAKNSINEPGIVRFDFLQQEDDPSSFLLVEIYKNDDAIAKHKQTPHYAIWREKVENMMIQPRKSTRYNAIFPEDRYW
jgi:(4S)-4-hydroxy-5-phosphonooxypentane-2,3-dione isomerase